MLYFLNLGFHRGDFWACFSVNRTKMASVRCPIQACEKGSRLYQVSSIKPCNTRRCTSKKERSPEYGILIVLMTQCLLLRRSSVHFSGKSRTAHLHLRGERRIQEGLGYSPNTATCFQVLPLRMHTCLDGDCSQTYHWCLNAIDRTRIHRHILPRERPHTGNLCAGENLWQPHFFFLPGH